MIRNFTPFRRGRVPRPGGKMLDIRIIFGESVTGRFRDGEPVPYNLSLQLPDKLQSEFIHSPVNILLDNRA